MQRLVEVAEAESKEVHEAEDEEARQAASQWKKGGLKEGLVGEEEVEVVLGRA